MSLMLQFKLSFEELVDSMLHLEAVEKERDSSDETEVCKNSNKKKFQFHKLKFFPQKKKFVGSNSQPSGAPSTRKECFNCGSSDHMICDCPKPICNDLDF
jgi:hypothetical protein